MPYILKHNGRDHSTHATLAEAQEAARLAECATLGIPATHPGTDAPVEPIAWGGEYASNPDGSIDATRMNPDVSVGGWWRVERVE